MAQNIAVESLLKEWHKLNVEKRSMLDRFNQQISELETAIDQLTGKTVWEFDKEWVYDDTHPDYIKGSIED